MFGLVFAMLLARVRGLAGLDGGRYCRAGKRLRYWPRPFRHAASPLGAQRCIGMFGPVEGEVCGARQTHQGRSATWAENNKSSGHSED